LQGVHFTDGLFRKQAAAFALAFGQLQLDPLRQIDHGGMDASLGG